MADRELGKFFRKAEKDLQEVARKHGFELRLTDDIKGTWIFLPEVAADWEPEEKQGPICGCTRCGKCGTYAMGRNKGEICPKCGYIL